MKYRVIWNVTDSCHHSCTFCFMNAIPSETDAPSGETSHLTLSQKCGILRNLASIPHTIDFSGGDPLSTTDDVKVIEYASKLNGPENISITTTGHSLQLHDHEQLAKMVRNVDITYDYPHYRAHSHRPLGYNGTNLAEALKLQKHGVKIKAQIPLTKHNGSKEVLTEILHTLARAGVDSLQFLRYFPLGRQDKDHERLPLRDLVSFIAFEARSLSILHKIKWQCAITGIVNTHEQPCLMLTEKLGLDPFGNLYACAWGSHLPARQINNPFYLGSLLHNDISQLLASLKASEIVRRQHDNQPHCKVFCYLNGDRSFDSCFKNNDPAFSKM